MALYFCLINTDRYRNLLLPAFHAFRERSECSPLQALIKEAITLAAVPDVRRPGFIDLPAAVYEEFGGILAGTEYYNRLGFPPERVGQMTTEEDLQFFVTNILFPPLLVLLCADPNNGLNPWQNMSAEGLTNALYVQSRWMEDRLTFAVEMEGEQPEIMVGDWSLFLADQEEEGFRRALSITPEALAPEVLNAYINLRDLLQQSSSEKNYRILACIV